MPDKPLEKPLDIIIEPKKVAKNSEWVAGIKDDGTFWTWGTHFLDRDSPYLAPTKIEGINDVVAVSAGFKHILLLKKDGAVWVWTRDFFNPNDKHQLPASVWQIDMVDDVVDIEAGNDSFFLTKQGEIYTIGVNEKGWINGINQPNHVPTKVPNLTNIVRVQESGGVLVALNKQGEIYTTGAEWRGLGREVVKRHDHDEIAFYPAQKVELPHKAVDFFVVGASVGVLLETGEVWVWGTRPKHLGIELPDGEWVKKPIKHPHLNQIINIGEDSAVTNNGDLYIWGSWVVKNNALQSLLGNEGVEMNIYRPIRIMQNVQPSELHHNAILLKNGELWTWGDNDRGLRGVGTMTNRDEYYEKDYLFTPEKSLFTTH